MTAILAIVGENVTRLRKERGWSQEELASAAHLHRTYVGGIERGERNLTVRNLARLADALDVDPYELLIDPHSKG